MKQLIFSQLALFLLASGLLTDSTAFAQPLDLDAYPLKVTCEGLYPGHLQGVCLDGEGHIFWSFTTWLVKTDLQGKLIKKVPVDDHHGDACYVNGRVYIAVNLGDFNNPQGKADSWVYVYDAENLKELARHEVQQVIYGAGGMAYHDGRFLVVGGLPEEIDENYLYEFDEQFSFVRRHTLASGHTHLGIQGATYAEGNWWFACYGSQVLVADEDFNMKKRFTFECGYGIVGLSDSHLYIARGQCDKQSGCDGYLLQATPDDIQGLKIAVP